MNLYNFSSLLFAFCYFTLGLLVFLKRQDLIGKTYFATTSFSAFWGIAYAILMSDNLTYSQALLTGKILNTIAVFIAPSWCHFAFVYVDHHRNRWLQKFLIVSYLCAALLSCSTFSPWYITGVSSFKNYPTPGPLYHIYMIHFFICFTAGFIVLIRNTHQFEGLEKKRFLLFMIVNFMGFIVGSLTFLPMYGVPLPLYWVFLMPIYPFLITYLISRKNLFSMEDFVTIAHNDKLTAMGILSASINHELRNPLYIIKNFSESLAINSREGVYKDLPTLQNKMHDTLDRITKQSNQAMKIIGRLTAFARKKPDQDFKMIAVNLRELIEDLDILIRCEIEIHKIEIIQEIPQDLPQLLADPAHLEEILLNLILNAYQVLKNFPSPIPLPEGEGTGEGKKIYITASHVIASGAKQSQRSPRPFGARDDGRIRIIIKDNGPGISPEDLPNIFKPFYTKKKEGLGLGLYITKQLIEKNQGTIKIESSPGQGASFILEFQKAINA